MSKEYEGKDLNAIAVEAERDLNSGAAKEGHSVASQTKGNTNSQGGQGSGVGGRGNNSYGASDSTLVCTSAIGRLSGMGG